ncbi:uncharacterized protein LOC111383250 [Olea europaea var. sylvestris]|uniref:uncharacterized protein LOC111383250 n=1 Tax=Olea europaea var. sylvestris TaxID=158386 RepID=UPI000C1D4B04|nr:uncharacterized protein LOC111383250 [Olea europaea var. sylvestris]
MGAQNESNKIWFFWNSGTNVTVIVDHPQFLHVRVEDPRLARAIYLTPVYASCDATIRRDLWAGLHHISLDMDDPWLVGGDFNVITHDGERTGHNTRNRGTTAFSDMMLDCGLEDAGFIGNRYTWTNGMTALWKKFFRLKQGLRWWNRHVFGDIFQRVRDTEVGVDEAEIIYDRDPTPEHRNLLHQTSAVAFYQDLLSAPPQPLDHIRSDVIPRLLTVDDNLALNRPPLIHEVREAVFSIDADSVAGPDGFSSLFFQHCWDIIQEDVYRAVLDFFDGGHLPRGFAATSIVLLPKKDGACRWTEFRPISLCTVFNNIITKLLNTPY